MSKMSDLENTDNCGEDILDKALKDSTLHLWMAYTDKKQQCEILRDMLKECEILLTQGTEEHCINMAFEIEMYFREEKH